MWISLAGGGEFPASLIKEREIIWCDTYYTCALWNKETHLLCTQLGEWCVWEETTVLQLLGVCSPGLCSTQDDNKLIGISCLTITWIKSRAAHARHQQNVASSQPGKYTQQQIINQTQEQQRWWPETKACVSIGDTLRTCVTVNIQDGKYLLCSCQTNWLKTKRRKTPRFLFREKDYYEVPQVQMTTDGRKQLHQEKQIASSQLQTNCPSTCCNSIPVLPSWFIFCIFTTSKKWFKR